MFAERTLDSTTKRHITQSWNFIEVGYAQSPGRADGPPVRHRSLALIGCATHAWEVDPFVKGSLGLSVHDFGVRT